MAKVTGKFQITLPKHLVEAFGIKVGDTLELIPAGDRISIVPTQAARPVRAASRVLSADDRLRYFDEATRRQRTRERNQSLSPAKDRGWTRDDLYDRGRSR